MTTAELINLLREIDPTGDLPVSHVSGAFVRAAYWDGPTYDWRVEGEEKIPTALTIREQGDAVQLDIESFQVLAFSHKNVAVDYDSEGTRKKYAQKVEDLRARARPRAEG